MGAALEAYLEICYIDLNGPMNTGGYSDPDFPAWNPEMDGFLAPAIVERVVLLVKQEALVLPDVEKLFVTSAKALHSCLKLPVAPERAWVLMKKELQI